ncbi:MAG: DUF6476 family protein [Gemmobacter sp.]
MDDTSEKLELPPSLRWLKWLVTGLTLTLILGVIAIVALLVTRLPIPANQDTVAFPDTLALPDGAVPEAITKGKGWTGVVTTDGRMFIFDAAGALTKEILIQR